MRIFCFDIKRIKKTIILVNGKKASLKTKVKEGDIITFKRK